jgi:pimeloyl-ACP methyl ester carboxylesterase
MAADTVALLGELKVEAADLFGYSKGAGVALEIAIRHPDLVRKLVVASLAYSRDGLHPEIIDVIESTKPEDLAGSVFQEAYARTAPNPDGWPAVIAKCNQLDREFQGWTPEDIQTIQAPTLVMIGDPTSFAPSMRCSCSG